MFAKLFSCELANNCFVALLLLCSGFNFVFLNGIMTFIVFYILF